MNGERLNLIAWGDNGEGGWVDLAEPIIGAGRESLPRRAGINAVASATERSHAARRTTTNHAFGPPSLKVKSFRSGRTS